MRRATLGFAALLALAFLPRPCAAQFGGAGGGGQGMAMGGMRPTVMVFGVETTEGNVVVGTISEISIKIETQDLGTLQLAPNALQSLVFAEDDGPGTLRTVQGSTINGKILLESVKLQSEFGPMTIERSKIRSIEARNVPGFGMGMMGGAGMMGAQPTPSPAARAAEEAKKEKESAIPKKN